ncbi:hypothetical protein M5D96_000038 [Drosophila gunungcola]|uniref:Uncharacterized protein n=1 Tax=Drosophila gunungcola TaxID=103775 RepID=A0A9Q0BU12_9MUSC|nr:hypothetical protein M5D96_000038 [Drosophila gunungcola]
MTQSDSPTFDVTQLSSSALCSKGGVQLPPLMLKGQIRPDQVANARFRLVEADRRPLSDQRFNALIKRLVKCFMSEVEITKRLRKVTARRSVPPADLQLIRHLEALRRNYETERSVLGGEAQPGQPVQSVRLSSKAETPSKSDKILPMKSRKHDYDVRSRQRQSGGSGSAPRGLLRRPIVCNHIETPVDLSHRLREKLYRLQETSKAPLESAQIKESSPDTAALSPSSQVSPSSSDVFYDIAEMEDYDLLSLS